MNTKRPSDHDGGRVLLLPRRWHPRSRAILLSSWAFTRKSRTFTSLAVNVWFIVIIFVQSRAVLGYKSPNEETRAIQHDAKASTAQVPAASETKRLEIVSHSFGERKKWEKGEETSLYHEMLSNYNA